MEDGDFHGVAANKGKKLPAEKVKPGGPENEAQLISETNLGAAVYGNTDRANGAVYVQSNTHLFSFPTNPKSRAPRNKWLDTLVGAWYPGDENQTLPRLFA